MTDTGTDWNIRLKSILLSTKRGTWAFPGTFPEKPHENTRSAWETEKENYFIRSAVMTYEFKNLNLKRSSIAQGYKVSKHQS